MLGPDVLIFTEVEEIVEPLDTAAPFAVTLNLAVPSSAAPVDNLTDFLLEVVLPLVNL